jgi:hypothetical protein
MSTNKQLFWNLYSDQCTWTEYPDFWFSRGEIPSQISDAAAYDHIKILDWHLHQFLVHKRPLQYVELAIDFACTNRSIKVLDWFLNAYLNYGIVIKHSNWIIDFVVEFESYANILAWWYNVYLNYGIVIQCKSQKAKELFNVT